MNNEPENMVQSVDPQYEAFLKWQAAQSAEEEAAKPKEYYVHLADGNVVQLSQEDADNAGTHYDGVQVIAKYEVGA